MSESKAQQLQNAALRIAIQNRSGVDLTRITGRAAHFEPLPETSVQAGQHVVILGAGQEWTLSKIAQRVGRNGSVRIIESEQAFLEQAKQQANGLEEQLGYTNWRFDQASPDDLRTDPLFLSQEITNHPVNSLTAYHHLQAVLETQRQDRPLIATASVDVVIITHVINTLPRPRMIAMLSETLRILRRRGRLLLQLILADEPIAQGLPTLPNGRVLRSLPQEQEIVSLLTQAGYYGITYTQRAALPMKVVKGVELRAFLIEAYKDEPAEQLDRGHAVIYRGPWYEVRDEQGRSYVRGERVAVSEDSYQRLQQAPYQQDMIGLPCYLEVLADQAPPFDETTPRLRDPQITKGKKTVFDLHSNGCDPSSGCCS